MLIESHTKNERKESAQRKIKIERKTQNKKIMFFDLDETLAHCTQNDGKELKDQSDVFLKLWGQKLWAPMNIRKSAKECLEVASRYFEVVVFTASVKDYADAFLDFIDPTNTLIHHRFYWDSCIKLTIEEASIYVKDLSVFEGFDLSDMVIIDNAVYSFINQLDNGIPIIPFRWDKDDDQLEKLI